MWIICINKYSPLVNPGNISTPPIVLEATLIFVIGFPKILETLADAPYPPVSSLSKTTLSSIL